jgi:eukaryotic translation initiation factor 2C
VRATLGVSYAAPAYYADRLCERARCYLRDFFSPSSDMRKSHDKHRKQKEKDEGLWAPTDMDNMTRAQKDKERARVKEKKDRVEMSLEKDTMEKARRRLGAFNPYDGRRDGDYDKLAVERVMKTMYWM